MSRLPAIGEKIEFLSDALTDKGPATGEIKNTKITVDGLWITVGFPDGQQSFSWDDLDDAGADVRGHLWMVKSHVKGHMRGGHYVRPYQRQDGMPHHPEPHHHPKPDDAGKPVLVKTPHHASGPTTWGNANAVATFLPGGDIPKSLNGVRFSRWKDHPTTKEGWDYCEGINREVAEPPFHAPMGKHVAAGVIVEEKDGRVWLCAPTNEYGGYVATYPKGTAEKGLSLQGNALKECFEEAGLKVRITGFIGDFERTTSVARMYRAVRIGGDPTDMGWESQAVHLVPKSHLYEHLNGWADHPVAEAIGAGPAPEAHKKFK